MLPGNGVRKSFLSFPFLQLQLQLQAILFLCLIVWGVYFLRRSLSALLGWAAAKPPHTENRLSGFYERRGERCFAFLWLELRLDAGYCRFHGCNLLAGFLIGA